MRCTALLLAIGVLFGVAATAPGTAGRLAPGWVITDLGVVDSGYGGGGPVAINARGQVIGNRDVGPSDHGFLWENGKMTDLGSLPGTDNSAVAAINGRGQIIGWSNLKNYDRRAFLWQNGRMIELDSLGGADSWASAMNDRGEIVGGSTTASGEWHATMWSRGKTLDLGTLGGKVSEGAAINRHGLVVGHSRRAFGDTHAFTWKRGKMTALGKRRSSALDVNDRGDVVGWSDVTHRLRAHAVLWRNGRMIDLGRSQFDLRAWAINERGQILLTDEQGITQFLWERGRRVRLRMDAAAINDRGQIIGRVAIRRAGASGLAAAIWENGKITMLKGLPGTVDSGATAINERGQIGGWNRKKDGAVHAVLWTSR